MKFTKSSQIINALSAALQQWLDETLAVLVLYKTQLHDSVTYTSFTDALKKNNVTIDWFVYDNNPVSPDDKTHESGITIRSDTSNPGVSKAYNEGFKLAASQRKRWLLLLDQDTHFSADSIAQYYAALAAYPAQNCFVPRLIDRVGIISPFKFRLGNGFRVSSVMDGIQSFNKLQVVNSGLMISVNAFQQASGYDEDFPLDFSDYAFVERIRKVTNSFVLIPVSANHNHSSLQNLEVNEELKRFNLFVSAAKLFRKKYHPANWFIIIRPFLRALKLSMRHKTLVFITKYFDSMSHD